MALTAAQIIALVSAPGAAAAAGEIAAVGEASEGAAMSLQKVSLIAGGIAAAAIIGLGVISAKMAGDFQSGMTSLVTGAGEAQANLAMIAAGIKQTAIDTGTSTQQLIAGEYMIDSAGIHGAASLQALKDAAEGAKVGTADLGDVANGMTTIMKDFGTSSSVAVNTLIATVANGKTHMADLVNTLSTILPTASAVGISLTDVSAAMATMTGEGVDAANASTYLRQLLIALTAPGQQAKDTLASIGLTSQQVFDEMKVSLPGALQLIEDHLSQKFPAGSAQYLQALKDIAGGSKQMQGILDLTGDHLQTFKDNVTNISTAVDKGGNSITGWALVQDTFNQKMDKAKEVLEVFMINLGQKLLPVLGDVVSAFTDKMVPAIQNVAGFISTHEWAFDALKASLIGLAGAIVIGVVPALWSMAVAVVAATWPFLAIAAAIAGVVFIGMELIQHWGDIVNFIKSAFINELKGLELEFNFVKNTVQNVINGIVSGLSWLYDHNYYIKNLTDIMTKSFNDVKHDIGIVLGWLENAWTATWTEVTREFNVAKTAVATALNMLTSEIEKIWNGLIGKGFSWGANLIQGFINGMLGNLNEAKNAGGKIVDAIKNQLGFHSPAKEGPGADADTWGPNLVAMLAQTMLDNRGKIANAGAIIAGTLQASLSGITGSASMSISGSSSFVPSTFTPLLSAPSSVSSSSGQNQTIIIQLDGRIIGQIAAKNMPSTIRVATGVRGF